MKFGLEIADAWLGSISAVWKRVLFFWGFLVATSVAGQWAVGYRIDMEEILRFGGVTYVILGRLSYLTLLVAPYVWFRFIHLEEGGVKSFLFLGLLVALNAGFHQRLFRYSNPWQLHAVVLVFVSILLVCWIRGRSRGK